MKKTTKAQFHEFIKHCERYRAQLSLWDWQIYYRHEKLDDAYATADIDLPSKTVTIKFNSDLEKSDFEPGWIERTAKHEMIHVFIGRITYLAGARYITDSELEEATEELVFELEHLIK